MAEQPLMTREQWAAWSGHDAERYAQDAAIKHYHQRAHLFDQQALLLITIGQIREGKACRDMAIRLRYWAHVEETNPGPPMTW